MRKCEGHQLHIDGEPEGPVFDDIRLAAGYALDRGFATPEKGTGRIVLTESATIERKAMTDAQ